MTNDQEHKGAMETVRHTRKANILGACLAALIALTAITASAASAATPPTVVTKAASVVGQYAATLNATVDVNGPQPHGYEITACEFEYGTTTGYGSTVPCNYSEEWYPFPKPVEARITNLRANTTYHFRISATTVEGTSQGADETFTTARSQPPEFGNCQASPTHEGRYGDAACTEPVNKVYGKYNGGYEWHTEEEFRENFEGRWRGLKGYKFAGGEIGATTFETTTGKQITCPIGELGGMQIENSKDVGEILVTYYGCESEGEPCRSEFHFEGVITDENQASEGEGLKGELVSLSGKKSLTPSVGLTLTSFKPRAPLFTVACNGHLGDLEIGGAGGKKEQKAKGDAAIAVISPVDQRSGEYTETFSQTGGVQEPLTTENGKERSLQMYDVNEHTWTQMGLSTSWTMTAERGVPPVEVKAIK